MYVYTAYNLGIHSELPLPELIPSDKPADVVIRFGKLNDQQQNFSDGGNYLLARIAQFGMVLLKDGKEIVLDPDPGVDEALTRTFLLGAIICVLLRQRGLLVLHASSVVINGSAVAFMADSGFGKSTLAECFHAHGYSILTDDVLAIQVGEQQPLVIPGFPQIKLWPDAATSFGHVPDSLPLLNSQTIKRVHRLQDGFFQKSVPLKKIYVLAGGTQPEIVPLEPKQSFGELVRHSREMQALTAPEFLKAHFQQCLSVVQQVPICSLQRQRSLAALPELVKLVENDLAERNLSPVTIKV
ncbi:serine kinase [Nostoc sp. FACHB-87]|uniref:serine kinase n=1 Tax=Nostocaceae TaxID=1162 RepID=UPI001688F1CB|nr:MULTISPECIES: serine kinase [Nostocaceae]MBD2454518.1 serine kinase [Nostoc sp. FACHB-87]MBD2474296.1 serine kinase [Anabaena sp. FACHB-83]